MSIKPLNDQRGQVVVFTMLIFQVLVVLIIFALNYATLVHAKIKLQIAADRAIFAGVAKLSYLMNEIAKENWAINRAFRKVEDNFGPNAQQSTAECDQRVTEMLNTQKTASDKIQAIIQDAYGEANDTAKEVLAANYPDVSFIPVFGADGQPLLDVLYDNDQYGEQRRNITCSSISGFFLDPKDSSTKSKGDHLRYVFMSPDSFVGIAGRFNVNFRAPLLSELFGDIQLNASSAGQPYGGSIKYFALITKNNIDQAVGEARDLIDDGKAYWYRPALVPVAAFYDKIQAEMPNGEMYYH